MRQSLLISIVFGILNVYGYSAYPSVVQDSTGVIRTGGKSYITHRVESRETLYSLSRRYNAAVQDIIDANPGSVQGLKAGSILRIPFSAAQAAVENGRTHTVEPGETLYAISKQYDLDIETLRSLNNLTDNSLRVGQKLRISSGEAAKTSPPKTDAIHIVKPSETLYSISRLYNTSPAKIRGWNNMEGNQLKVGQKLRIEETTAASEKEANASSMLPRSAVSPDKKEEETPPAATKPETREPVTTRPPERDYSKAEKITQHGLAEVITDSEETRKYLAMHRSAPVGTIMQIRNEMNDQVVFVRVVGTIQGTGDNEKVLVMISQKAYDRLGAVDRRFPVEISYIP